ncbi:MAG: DUF6273 domain-containing protein [Fermentimonas sp.]|nr:DUF6273 domain-containing protein [Fermentimonas sp.]
MKVLRKQELETSNIQVGDQIVIELTGFGEFTATAQKITDKGTLFLFDDCVTRRPMNAERSNKGGYEKSELCKWINNVLLPAFPEDLRDQIDNLTIPTYGQMFGHDDWYNDVMEPDDDEPLPLMKKRKNRIADFNDDYEWYWLKNATKKEVSSSYFANVNNFGHAYYYNASNSNGVRPVFWLVE